ncbi:MAG: MoxR family ATPase [Desulfuromusa sp.]|nr:MoxR family ATPase [Desulfuromusa sp.]
MSDQLQQTAAETGQTKPYVPKYIKLPPGNVLTKQGEEEPYVFSDQIAIAIDVAFSTKRPLLVSGDPGCGKSRLAKALARQLKWTYRNKTITSRTTLEDLTHNYDHLRRLHDAHSAGAVSQNLMPEWIYNRPGIFWWAFNSDSAVKKGQEQYQKLEGSNEQKEKANDKTLDKNKMVILIDEIDKAEPDLPNDLLDLLEYQRIELIDGQIISAEKNTQTFIIITSNRERSLPKAFVRRCVVLEIKNPDIAELIKIARSHFGDDIEKRLPVEKVAEITVKHRDSKQANLHKPGTSEFIDTLKTCIDLKITPDKKPEEWAQVEALILRKTL